MNISKSQYIKGLQCHKTLWLYKHRRELMAEPDQNRLRIFDTGHRVGDLAKSLFPGGTEIEFDAGNFRGMIAKTKRLVAEQQEVIYEATFSENGVFAMSDILVRNGNAWDFYEVKSSTGVKPYHEHDAAIQWFALSNQIQLNKAFIVHINTSYTFKQKLDVQQLFTIVDITESVKKLQQGIKDNLNAMAQMLKAGEPDILIGNQCANPFDCDFKPYCWAQVPVPSVFDLHRLSGDRKFELFHQGLETYKDLQGLSWNATQSLQIETAINGKPHIDAFRVGEFIKKVKYPVAFLDFETFQDAVPKLNGQRPYMQLPFQYSLHILHQDGHLEHKEYLGDEHSDPRPALAKQLVSDITSTGTILAFNQSFEKSVIKALASAYEKQAEVLLSMNDRFIDLITPFRDLMYYHPAFNGSFSLKSILPALFPDDDELDYKKLNIQGGESAMGAYAVLDKIEDTAEKQKVKESLLAYCKLDTLAMVKIWQRLNDVAG